MRSFNIFAFILMGISLIVSYGHSAPRLSRYRDVVWRNDNKNSGLDEKDELNYDNGFANNYHDGNYDDQYENYDDLSNNGYDDLEDNGQNEHEEELNRETTRNNRRLYKLIEDNGPVREPSFEIPTGNNAIPYDQA
ncbi:uncharacterized protein LOC123298978 [Chrysoperla carnea]|uniref:uncharacterized protein LOC123298978 n=1 Tax=Chrysoperla carnea TaxID=189513 RepID=UPI001D06E05A|nr:uncharacterized protein LOC123298978 [Chrysoperla carnea]